MNYDQRISQIKHWFKEDIAKRFNMPRDLDPLVVATDAVEAVNSHIHSQFNEQQMSQVVAFITKDLVQSAKSRTLPTVREFGEAAMRASERVRASLSAMNPSPRGTTPADPTLLITEARIKRGESIPDTYLRGTMRELLLEKTSITAKDLVPYEKSLAMTASMQ
jgi:hypothetical protein